MQVETLLKEVNVSKSKGPDMILPRLIEAAAIGEPIGNIFNTSDAHVGYPSVRKMGQVTPLFKKNDEIMKENYRPVTVIPVLTIYMHERLIVAHIGGFYKEFVGFRQLL